MVAMELDLFIGTVLILYFSIYLVNAEKNRCSITIKSESLYGRTKLNIDGSIHCEYTNIPYAYKPTRFEPARLKLINEVVGKRYRNTPKRCIQGSREFVSGQEDCIYLHIYTSLNVTKTPQPVFAYLHGGSFNVGSPGEDLKNIEPFLQKQIIFVTINYRLGLFGFAAGLDGTIEANLGLEDQRLALQWINENIHYFNGDVKKITLVGWSAGASSVTYHLYSKRSKALFSKAIIMSGTFLNPWSFNVAVDQCFDRLCDHLNIKPCTKFKLQGLRTLDLVPKFSDDFHFYYFGALYACFLPTLGEKDGFVSEAPFKLILRKPVNNVPILMGFTSLEENCDSGDSNEFSVKNYVPPFQDPSLHDVFINISIVLQRKYPAKAATEFQRMADLKHGIIKFAEMYPKFSKSSLYLYRFASSYNMNRDCAFNENGAMHGDDLKFIFWDEATVGSDRLLKKLRLQFINLWTNFIKTGKPSPTVQGKIIGSLWHPYNPPTRQILNIDRKITNKTFKLSKIYLDWDRFLNCCQYENCSDYKFYPTI